MDGQPEILSSGRERPGRRPRWPWSAGGGPSAGPAAVIALGVLLACLGGLAYTATLVTHRDKTIDDLRAALRVARAKTRDSQSSATRESAPPVYSGSAILAFPDKSGGSFSVVAAAVRPGPGSGPLTWLFVYGKHAAPGARYGLLGGTCGGQYVAPVDWADGTANRNGDLTIVAPDLAIEPQDPKLWILVYRLKNGVTLGGITGPFIGGGSKTFRSAPPC